MKHTLLCILFSFLLVFSACSNDDDLPNDPAFESGISAPVESQAPPRPAEPPSRSVASHEPADARVLPSETLDIGSDTIAAFRGENGRTGLLNTETHEIVAEAVFDRSFNFSDGLVRMERGVDVFYFNEEGEEVIPAIPFIRPPGVEHPLRGELTDIVSGFSREYVFPEFSDVDSMDFFSPEVSSNLFTATLVQYRDLYDELGLPGVHVRYEDMNALGRLYFGDGFLFPENLEVYEFGPSDSDPKLFCSHSGRGGMPLMRYILTDISEQEETYIATFLPYRPNISWDDGTVTDIHFPLNPTPNRGRLEYPDEETRMKTVADEVDCLDYYRLLFPQELLGTITVAFQRADDGRMIAISSRYNRG